MSCKSILSSRVAVVTFLLFVCLYFCRSLFPISGQVWMDITKCAPVLFLSIATWCAGGSRFMPLALLLSAAGDLAGEEHIFLLQLSLFALAHIAYIVYFAKNAIFGRKGAVVACLWGIVMLSLGCFIIPHITSTVVQVACSVYVLMIGTMALFAFMNRGSYRVLNIIAALLFVASDSCIAINKFVGKFEYAGIIIMTTYFAAQLIFAYVHIRKCSIKC